LLAALVSPFVSANARTPLVAALAVGALVGALPVPGFAPAVGGALAAALITRSRRLNASLGAAVGCLGGLGYLAGWSVLALVLSGAFPPALPNGEPFAGFATFLLVIDSLGGALGGLVGGHLARRARSGSGAGDRSGIEQPE
jgi:hypothetical protein